ncbi:hypothetical protein BDQ17DRAFT_1364905 [Cyathus striatus]|nr:hypothetical protein BDQ17DRAFT_1364905 [Cyathus striatus]
MLSFNKLTVLTTIACAAFSTAAPIVDVVGEVIAPVKAAAGVANDVTVVKGKQVAGRDVVSAVAGVFAPVKAVAGVANGVTVVKGEQVAGRDVVSAVAGVFAPVKAVAGVANDVTLVKAVAAGVLDHVTLVNGNQKAGRDLVDIDALIKAPVDVAAGVLDHVTLVKGNQVAGRDVVDAVVQVIAPVTAGVQKAGREVLPRDDDGSLVAVFVDITSQVSAVCDKIYPLLKVNVAVEIDAILPLLNEIVVILQGALVRVQVIVKNPGAALLKISGKILSIQEFAVVVHGLIGVVVTLFFALSKVVVAVKADVLAAVIVQITGLVGQILALVFALLPGLLDIVVKLIASLGPIILQLKLTALVQILGLH